MTDEPNFTPETHSTYEPTPQEVADREIEQLVAQVRAGIGNRQEWFQDEAHRSLDRHHRQDRRGRNRSSVT